MASTRGRSPPSRARRVRWDPTRAPAPSTTPSVGPPPPFASWEENIATVAAGLKKGYIDEGLTTLAQIQAKYAPLGAANDPGGLNSNWLTNTTLLYGELGGNPAGSVAVAPSVVGTAPSGTV